jgi:FkbM family methyltransferase
MNQSISMISAQGFHDDGSSDPPEHAASAVRSCREVISLVPLQVRIRRFLGLEDIQGHHVYAPGLSASSLAIDAGANNGAFSTALVRRFGCRVIALEANPILTGGRELPREIDWRNMALAATSGEALFRVSQNPEASSLREDLVLPRDVQSTRMVEVTSLTDLSRREGCGGFDLVKLDIEGAEIDVLMSESDEMLRSIRQIAVEFHSFIAGDQELIALRRPPRMSRTSSSSIAGRWPFLSG